MSFAVYLNDKHAALDLITGMTCNETRGLLRDLQQIAPHALAKALAVRFPWSADQADETEHHVQDLLPFGTVKGWREAYDIVNAETQRRGQSSV